MVDRPLSHLHQQHSSSSQCKSGGMQRAVAHSLFSQSVPSPVACLLSFAVCVLCDAVWERMEGRGRRIGRWRADQLAEHQGSNTTSEGTAGRRKHSVRNRMVLAGWSLTFGYGEPELQGAPKAKGLLSRLEPHQAVLLPSGISLVEAGKRT